MAFNQYRGRSVGRLMYFLYRYHTQTDSWQFGNGIATYHGTKVAEYTWDGDTDIPTFKFFGNLADHMHQQQDFLKDQLTEGEELYSLKAENSKVKCRELAKRVKLYEQIVGQRAPVEKRLKWMEEIQEKYGDDKLY